MTSMFLLMRCRTAAMTTGLSSGRNSSLMPGSAYSFVSKQVSFLVWRAANAFTRSSYARVGPSVSSNVVQTSSSSSSSVPWKNSGLETLLVRIHWLSSSTHML